LINEHDSSCQDTSEDDIGKDTEENTSCEAQWIRQSTLDERIIVDMATLWSRPTMRSTRMVFRGLIHSVVLLKLLLLLFVE